MTNLLIAVSTVILALTIQAEELAGTQSTALIQELVDQGVTQVGSLDLLQLKKEIKTVQWETMRGTGTPFVISRFRRSAYYSIAEKKVTVKASTVDEPIENLKLLELHESLGALGYRDGNYSQSTALNILNKIKDPALRKRLLKAYGSTTFNSRNLKAARGGSSVGGGGDSEALMLKNQLFDEILKDGQRVLATFYTDFPEVNFEPWLDQETQAVWAQYQAIPTKRPDSALLGATQDRNFYEVLTIFYPALLWKKEFLRERILSDIKSILLGIYPAFNSEEMILMRLKGCTSSTNVYYPNTDNDDILTLQQAQTKIHLGCENFNMGLMTYIMWQKWILKPGQFE